MVSAASFKKVMSNNTKRVVVLGCGRVGAVMAKDLAEHSELEVTAVDARREALQRLKKFPCIKTKQVDLSNLKEVKRLIGDFDLAVGSVPGFMGFAMMKTVISAGVDYADISFFPEDPFELDEFAQAQGVTVVVDCGVAPGLSNMLVGYVCSLFDEVEDVLIMVGGLPKKRTHPWEYKAPFSPLDVIEEYTRPARFIRNGRKITMPALTDVELVHIPDVGTLEAFNTDGLRTLTRTIKARNMREKTLRYPGYAERIRLLRDSGFFDRRWIKVGDVRVRPIDVTTQILFPLWEPEESEDEFTVMEVRIEGSKEGKRMRYTYNLFDSFDKKTKTTSMARTTGFTNSIIAHMIATGEFRHNGICPPEYIGRNHRIFKKVLGELKKRNIRLKQKIEELD
jgi:saccharopine dehydrogenase-like NADP-dependent oxidoreductase